MKIAPSRRQPQMTVLYQVVKKHLAAFLGDLALHQKLPRFIEVTLRAFLECGIPDFGCMVLRCVTCGHEEVVAFSCKRRGVCPSCAARRMQDGVRHLLEHVLPVAPYRQWVVSLPLQWNGKLAFQPRLLAKIERAVAKALQGWMEQRCGGGQTGLFVERHRFGARLELLMHLHVVMVDGVYCKNADGSVTFGSAPQVSAKDVQGLVEMIQQRLEQRWKKLDMGTQFEETKDSEGKAKPHGAPLADVEEDEVEHPRGGLVGKAGTWSVCASEVIAANDRDRLERLCRYVLRGPISNSRLTQRADGNLEYRLRKRDRDGNAVIVLTPQQLLMKLSSLIPKNGIPVRRYFGVLAAGARMRHLVVPLGTVRKTKKAETSGPVQRSTDWAELFRRLWDMDAMMCPACHHGMVRVAILWSKTQVRNYRRGELMQGLAPPQLSSAG